MGLFIHVASRPDDLVSQLCHQLETPLGDLFAAEVIAVPTRGIERWLTQRIASELAERGVGDGICGNAAFPSPHQLIRGVLLEVPELSESVKSWEGPGFRGHILRAVDANLDEPWMRILARYLEPSDDHPGSTNPNRLSAAQKIARMFSAYARRRPKMIRGWAAGANIGSDGEPLPTGDLWQPNLWRVVRQQIAVPSLPELMPGALDPIRDRRVRLDLPERIAVYGLTATDPFDLEALVAMSAQTDVHLYVLHPSPALWEATTLEPGPLLSRETDTGEALCTHPLLKAWARDSRELQTVLAFHRLTSALVERDPNTPPSLLRQLQEDIRRNREPAANEDLAGLVKSGADASIQIHRCHGSRRQVEVLRDAILHVMKRDASLEPRDIVIMTPDLDTFAPLLEAAFPAESPQLPDLRLRIADRSPAVTNPLVRFTASLLSLAEGRLEAGAVRELVSQPVVQNRFGFDTETAGQIRSVIDDANISWGLDGHHRREWGAGPNDERTWSRGLERALMGTFYSDSSVRVVAGIAPMDGIEGQEGVPVALLAQIIDRITAIRSLLDQPMPMSSWAGAISSCVRLLAAPEWGEEWQWDQLERLLAETFDTEEDDTGEDHAGEQSISLADARMATARWTEDRPGALHFRTGNVTVCTLAPMRSVPYKVVCLLGLDEQRFPRIGKSDGDDLLLRHEFVGDHDRSAEDRQLLLDAIMAADQQLIVTYSGRDELSNASLPPAVPVAELEDTLLEMVAAEGMRRVITTHPLQAFSEANFTPDALGVAGPWGFDSMQLDGAKAVQRHDGSATEAAGWSSCAHADRLQLVDLIKFLQHPAKRFIRSRLGFTIPKLGDLPDDTLPADLDGLSQWGVKDRLLQGLVDGHDLESLAERERVSDALPPRDLGTDDLERAVKDVQTLWAGATERGYKPWSHVPASGVVQIDGCALEGSILVDPAQAHLITVTASTLRGKQRLELFAKLVFASALQPEIAWTAMLLGKRTKKNHMAVTMGPIGSTPAERAERAGDMLRDMVDLYNTGHDAPLPMPCETAYEWQQALGDGRRKAFGAAAKKWEHDYFGPECEDAAHAMVFPFASTGDMVNAGLDSYSDRLWGHILPLCTEDKL